MGDTTPGSVPLLHSPSELIDLIIFHVTSPSDLLHLALTCRALCDIIIPSHLEFRSISHVPISKHIWKYLIENPAQTRMVRSLQALGFGDLVKYTGQFTDWGKPERPYGPHKGPISVPSHSWLDDEAVLLGYELHKWETGYNKEGNFRNEIQPVAALWERKRSIWLTVCGAVKHMTFLEEFTWNQDASIPEDVLFRLACVLKDSCPYLESVTGKYRHYFWMGMLEFGAILPDGLTLNHFSIWAYSPVTLTHLSMDLSRADTSSVRPEILVLVFQIIGTSYPHLRSFNFWHTQLPAEHTYALLKNAHWPKLESLRLLFSRDTFDEATGSTNAPAAKAICRSFFRRHPLISSLALSTTPPSTTLLGKGTNELLSNLRSFHFDGELLEAFNISWQLPSSNLRSCLDTLRGLVFLSCSISPRCIAVLDGLPNLRYLAATIDINSGNHTLRAMLDILGRTTNLERLDLHPPCIWKNSWMPQEITFLAQRNSSPHSTQPHPLLFCLTHFILHNVATKSISNLMTPLSAYSRNYGDQNVPLPSPMTSLLTMMPNLMYLGVNDEQVWVLQSPGDRGEVSISIKHVKEGEVESSYAWWSLK